MTTQWTSPISTQDQLYLPNLSSNITPLTNSKSNIHIPITKEFLNSWTKGPKNHSSSEILNHIKILGKTFAKFITSYQGKLPYKTKTSPTDLVTEIDIGIEMLIRIWINKFLPHHKIIGEEGQKHHINENDYIWYIDPIDGTRNFVQQKNNVGINICCYHQGKPYLSYVNAPLHQKIYYTENQTKKVYKEQNNQIQELKPQKISTKITIGTEFGPQESGEYEKAIQITQKINANLHHVNAISINILDLIEGKVTLFYKNRLKIWDIAAPLALHYHLYQKSFLYELYLANIQPKIDFFSSDIKIINQLNKSNQTNSELGFIIACPTTLKKLIPLILTKYYI